MKETTGPRLHDDHWILEVQIRGPGGAPPTGDDRLEAALFSAEGGRVRQAAFDACGRLRLHCHGRLMASRMRLVVGPSLPRPSLLQLRRHGALERWIDPRRGHLRVRFDLPEPTLLRWLGTDCRVLGRLWAPATEGRRRPVAGATVEVLQLGALAERVRRMETTELAALRAAVGGWGGLVRIQHGEVVAPPRFDHLPADLRTELAAVALARDDGALRDFLLGHLRWLRPVLGPALLMGERPWSALQRVAVCRSDALGRFNTRFTNELDSEGPPDLVFRVTRPLGEGLTWLLYRPFPLQRHLHWAYDGRSVELICRDPLRPSQRRALSGAVRLPRRRFSDGLV